MRNQSTDALREYIDRLRAEPHALVSRSRIVEDLERVAGAVVILATAKKEEHDDDQED